MASAELQALNTVSRGAEKARDTRTGAGWKPALISLTLFIVFSFAVQGLKIVAEPVEAALPFEPQPFDPSLGLGQRRWIDAAGAHPSRLLRNDQPRGLQNRKMLHHRRQRHGNRPLELADRGRAFREPLDHRPAGGA